MTQNAAANLPRTWDGRLARRLVAPLVGTPVTPNHLTTLRLAIGIAGGACLAHGGYGWSNAGALLVALSNFVDHTDGELARLGGRSSRFGHYYDLAADAVVTVLLFAGLGIGVGGGVGGSAAMPWSAPPAWLGLVAGVAVAAIFYGRMRIEAMAGKAEVRQSFFAGFETEDVLYLLPLVTLTGISSGFVIAASIGAPLFALWVLLDYVRVVRRGAAPSNRVHPQGSR